MDSQFPICFLVHLAALLGVGMYVYLCSVLGTSKGMGVGLCIVSDGHREVERKVIFFLNLLINIFKVILTLREK